MREYNGNNLNLKIQPNRANSIEERNQLLRKLQYELHKALEAGTYLNMLPPIETAERIVDDATNISAIRILFEVTRSKLRADLSWSYKRDIKTIYRKLKAFLTFQELKGPITSISKVRIEKFLSQFGSTGTYYMNKRRTLGVLFNGAASAIDTQLKQVKESQRRKAKARLHEKYEPEQVKPILDWLSVHYPNLHICCLLTYGSWLRPHEEIRLLTKNDFKYHNSQIHLSGDENKGGKVRVVHVPEYARIVLETRLSGLDRNDNIFTLKSYSYNISYFNTQWSRAWVRMNQLALIFENQTIYSFRHTAAVQLYRRTKDVHLLQKLLGHSSIIVTLKYLRSLGEINIEELSLYAPQLEI